MCTSPISAAFLGRTTPLTYSWPLIYIISARDVLTPRVIQLHIIPRAQSTLHVNNGKQPLPFHAGIPGVNVGGIAINREPNILRIKVRFDYSIHQNVFYILFVWMRILHSVNHCAQRRPSIFFHVLLAMHWRVDHRILDLLCTKI